MTRSAALLLALVALVASPSGAETAPVRVLFVGNSLTYVNDLPAMAAWISRRGGESAGLAVESIAFANAGLQDHWKGEATARIERGGLDFVVLQQGPSSLPESRADLVAWTKRFAKRIRAAGARPVLYMVWPAAQHVESAPRVADSYRAAARAVDGLLAPAGEAWRAAWKLDPNLPLYGGDRFHPSALGTYLAALTLEAVLTGRQPYEGAAALEVGGERLEIGPEFATHLARAAREAIAAEGAR